MMEYRIESVARAAPSSRPRSRARVGRAMPARFAPRVAPVASSRRFHVTSRRADATTTRRIVAAAGSTRDGDDADDARRPRARAWASTNDARYARLTRDARARRSDADADEEGFRAASAAALARATRRRDATRRGDATRARDAYWGEDEGLSGWARMMGEEVDARAVDAVSYTHLTLPTILLV